ncbi:hypothetical protein D082_22270 [Synechocystis sp. PCC 6714]|nr:hypothetical protein D082_22270 [Synechocystis sp. PCC 6714]
MHGNYRAEGQRVMENTNYLSPSTKTTFFSSLGLGEGGKEL